MSVLALMACLVPPCQPFAGPLPSPRTSMNQRIMSADGFPQRGGSTIRCSFADPEPPAFFYRKNMQTGPELVGLKSLEPGLSEDGALLGGITVVLMGTKLPVSVGMVARACASFEVLALSLLSQ